MQKSILTKCTYWLLPAVLILFILEILLLPFAVDLTYADRSEAPSHSLTYRVGRLQWDENTPDVNKDGVAELDLFSTQYSSINGVTVDGGEDKVLAPGTSAEHYIRLYNKVGGPITYTAVLYEIKSDEQIPVEADMTAENAKETDRYSLPDGVKAEQVIKAVKGTLYGNRIQDFDINWFWNFEDQDNIEAQDLIDTTFGNRAEPDEMTLGFYIVVEDNNDYDDDDWDDEDDDDDKPRRPVRPLPPPSTGDGSNIGMYGGLMAVSGALLLFLLAERKKDKKWDE